MSETSNENQTHYVAVIDHQGWILHDDKLSNEVNKS